MPTLGSRKGVTLRDPDTEKWSSSSILVGWWCEVQSTNKLCDFSAIGPCHPGPFRLFRLTAALLFFLAGEGGVACSAVPCNRLGYVDVDVCMYLDRVVTSIFVPLCRLSIQLWPTELIMGVVQQEEGKIRTAHMHRSCKCK
jgi:hypothetical protein